MAEKCDDVGMEIVKKGNGVNKEIGKKCEDVNKEKTRNYEYVSKKFCFRRVLWIIKNPCITPPLKGKIFCIPEFYVIGIHLTRWEISLKRRFNEEKKMYEVTFRLRRLECQPFHENVVADCFVEYSGHDEGNLDVEFNHTFGVNMNFEVEKKIKFAGLSPIDDHHIPEFKLKLEILIYFEDLKESIPLCENLGVRRLSEHLRDLYDNGTATDYQLKCGVIKLKVHKAILYCRIRNEEFLSKITSFLPEIEIDEYGYKIVEKVIKFLYTGDLNYTLVSDPSVAVYKLAECLDIEPIIAYYNPDEITFISDTDVEEFSATWTIEDFCRRDDYFLQSPIMTNKMMDTKWKITVYPKGFRDEGVYLEIFLVYEATVPKDICLELFLLGGPDRRITYRCHQKINYEGKIKMHNFIELDKVVNNYTQDDSLTISLQLRMSTGQNNLPVCCETKADYKYLSEQKYYDYLSDDILSLYRNATFSNLRVYLNHHNITLDVHECILLTRCVFLYDSVKKYLHRFDNISIAVIFEIMHFVYSGKLDERSPLEVTFDLYRAAESFSYQHLKKIIIGKLHNILYESNGRAIYDFAFEQEIRSLEAAARIYRDLPQL